MRSHARYSIFLLFAAYWTRVVYIEQWRQAWKNVFNLSFSPEFIFIFSILTPDKRGCNAIRFQERATKISHGNTGRLAKAGGDETLGKICNLIAADEGRHEVAYQKARQGGCM